MVRETQTTRALREHATSLKAPSRQALRYLRSFIDKRPYTPIPVSHAELQELEELRQMGLWPPQTCNSARKTRRSERENLDVCGIEKREEKAERRLVPGLQCRQPEIRLDYEDASIIHRNRPRLVVEAPRHQPSVGVSTKRSIHMSSSSGSRLMHTTVPTTRPSLLLSQSSIAQQPKPKTSKRKNNWQYVLATVGRHRVSMEKYPTMHPLAQLHNRQYVSPIDLGNRALELRISKWLQTPIAPYKRVQKRSRLKDMMRNLLSQRKYNEAIQEFHGRAIGDRVPIECVEMCVNAYLKLGRITLARAVMEKFKTSYRPTKMMMLLLLKTLLARCKVDAAIFFIRMAKDTATGFGTILTKTLLEGVRKIGVEFARLREIFDFVESIVPTSQAMHYTIMIRGCIEANKLEMASELLLRMREANHIPDKWTYNAILVGAAKAGEWKHIRPILYMIKDQSLEVATSSMNVILNLATESHSRSIKDMYELIRALGAAWDMFTWNIMLKATLLKCPDKDIDHQVKAFFRKMRNAGVEPDTVTANTLLTKIKHSGTTSPRILRRLLVEICEKHELVGNRSKEILNSNMLANSSPQTTTVVIRKDMEEANASSVELRMIASLRELKPIEGLQIFQSWLSESIRPTSKMLLLAMKSVSLLPVKPYFPKTATETEREQIKYDHFQMRSFTIDKILQLSEQHGLDFSTSLSADARSYLSAVFSYRLVKFRHTVVPPMLFTPQLDTLFELYRWYHRHDLPNPHYPLMVTASNLFHHRQYEKTVELMRSIAVSEWGRRRPFDIVALTILLKAYIVIRDENGIKWIVDHLVERDLEPDRKFIGVLEGRRKVPTAVYILNWDQKAQRVVDESVRICKELKQRIMERSDRRKDLIVELLTDRVKDAEAEYTPQASS